MRGPDKAREPLVVKNEEPVRKNDEMVQGNDEAMQESAERYRTLTENSPDIIYIFDRTGMLLYVNRMAAAYMRQTPAALVGKTQQDLFPPDKAQYHLERIRKVFETGEAMEMEGLYQFDSQDVWLNVRSIPLRDSQGQISSVMGICRNITELKRTEKALLESEKRYRFLMESVPHSVWRTDGDGNFLDSNRYWFEYTGQTLEEAKKKGWSQVIHPDDLERVVQEVRKNLAQGHCYECEHRLRRASDGTYRWHLTRGGPVKDERGNVTGWIGSTTDIHDQKCAEEALKRNHDELELRVAQRTVELLAANERLQREVEERRRAEKTLRQSHDVFKAIYEGMIDGLLIVDVETKQFVWCNASIQRMLGYSEEELLEKTLMDIHPADEVPRVLKRFHDIIDGWQQTVLNVPVLRKDGSVFYVDISRNRFFYNERFCVVGFFRDITERKQTQEALERERQSLWQMLQASDHERQLISYEIHDGLAQYLAAAGMQFQSYDSLRRNSPDEAEKVYETAVELVRQAHLESRRLISEVRSPIIDETGLETALSHLVHEQRQRGVVDIEYFSNVQFGRLPSALENALYRIVQEALTNACKHSKGKKVTVTMAQEGQDVRLEVRDWGIGFRPESVEKGHFGLEGIRERVRLHGGRLTIESYPGAGTLIQVVVPIPVQPNGG
jgi:PAS domain S-box-containing protein